MLAGPEGEAGQGLETWGPRSGSGPRALGRDAPYSSPRDPRAFGTRRPGGAQGRVHVSRISSPA